MKKTLPAFMLGTLLASQSVLAATTAQEKFGIGVVGGTVGAGIQLGYKLNENLTLRGQFTKWSTSDTRTVDDIRYDVDLDIGSAGLYMDWHPWGGSFRVSAGITKNLDELRVKNKDTVNVKIGNTTYPVIAPGDVQGKISFNAAPYIGIGWGNAAPKGLGFRFDLGAHFLGKADVSFTDKSGTVNSADLKAEEQKAKDDIGDVIHPEVSFAIVYGW